MKTLKSRNTRERLVLTFLLLLGMGVGGCAQTELPPPPPPLVENLSMPEERPGVPFVPTPEEVVREMLTLAEVNSNDVVYDLGSGDGRIVIMAAQEFGARAYGVELKPDLVEESRQKAAEAGISAKATFLQQDLFDTDLSEATVVTMYLLPEVNRLLKPKLLQELAPGSRVVSHAFDMGDWVPDQIRTVGPRTVYLWIIPANLAGNWDFELEVQGHKERAVLELEQNLQHLVGTLSLKDRKFSVSQGKVKGTRLSLQAEGDLGSGPASLAFEGQLQGNRIRGNVRVLEGGGSAGQRWQAARR